MVTDNVNVGEARAVVTNPNGDVTNASMSNIIGTNVYYYNTTYLIEGRYYYYIWVRDTSNNENVSATYHFDIVADITPPITTNGSTGLSRP